MSGGEAKAFAKSLKSIKEAVDPNAIIADAQRGDINITDIPLRTAGAVDEQFPRGSLHKKKDSDAILAAKLALQNDKNPGVTPVGVLRATDKDFERLQELQEAEALDNYEQWFIVNFDKMSVAEKKWAREAYPQMYARRVAFLDSQLQLLREILILKIGGIQTPDQLKLQYAIEAGYIQVDLFENLLHPERASDNQDKERKRNFARGLFSSKVFHFGQFGTFARADNAQSATGRTAVGNTPFSGTTDADNKKFGFSTANYPKNNTGNSAGAKDELAFFKAGLGF